MHEDKQEKTDQNKKNSTKIIKNKYIELLNGKNDQDR